MIFLSWLIMKTRWIVPSKIVFNVLDVVFITWTKYSSAHSRSMTLSVMLLSCCSGWFARSLQNYSETPFNGVYLMFNSFLKIYCELPTILNDEQKRIYFKINRDSLEPLCSYLKNFCDVIEKLSCEKRPSCILTFPTNSFWLIMPLKTYIGKE